MTALAVVGWVLLIVAVAAIAVAAQRWGRRLGRVADRLAPEVGVLGGHAFAEALRRLERAAAHRPAAADGDVQLEQLVAVLGSIPQGVVVADGRGKVVFRNATAQTIGGPRHTAALLDEAVGDMVQRAVQGASEERTLDLFGPPRRILALRAAPFDVPSGGRGALAVVEDITERTRLEAVRTDFVANISHELKTPAGAIALLADTTLGEEDPEVRRRLTERMLHEAHRMGRTIDDLLELSRIELSERAPMGTVEVASLLKEAAARLRPAAERRDLHIEVLDPGDLHVVGDPVQLVSALANLLDNAVKYSDPGGKIELSGEDRRDSVALVVRDHGIGIPERDIERIFERFYRVDRARSRETGGTGLGLAIVRHIAANHDGSVTVDSAEGDGSTFTLLLPSPPVPTS